MFENYQVQANDTLESIARKFRVPVAEILKENNLETIFQLETGMTLRIPMANESAFELYTIQKGDTLFSLAKKNNITVDMLTILNGLEPNAYLYADETLLIPKEGIQLYLTKLGDSLQKIASLKETNPEDILVYNDRIYLLPDQIVAYRQRK